MLTKTEVDNKVFFFLFNCEMVLIYHNKAVEKTVDQISFEITGLVFGSLHFKTKNSNIVQFQTPSERNFTKKGHSKKPIACMKTTFPV